MPLLRVSLNDHWMNFTQMLTAMKIGQEKMYLYRQPVKNKNWTPNKLRNSKVRVLPREVIDEINLARTL
jgi:hypothetical protein